MKKTFKLTVPHKAPARQVDSVKSEIKKYMTREKRKDVPAGKDYWDFDCRIGTTADNARKIFPNEIKPTIDKYVADGKESFYLELIAKAKKRVPKNS